MRILQILPELGSGGVERGTVEVAGALQQSGHRAYVVSAGGAMVDGLDRVGASHQIMPVASKNPFRIWMNIDRLVSFIKSHKIQLVHARSRAPAWSAYYAAKACNVPFVTTFHGVYNGYAGNGWKHKYNAIMTKGERVIAVSNHVKAHIVEHYPECTPAKVQVIHRGADSDYFNPAHVSGTRTMELVKRWSIPDDLPIILLPARLTKWKGQHVVVEALANLSHRNFFCVMVGEAGKHPAYAERLSKQIQAANLEGHVRLVGTTHQMRDAYGLADVVICPSIEPEAFGRVPVEAQAMGKPVIATAHGGAMETVIADQTGMLVEPNNVQDMSRAIERMLHLTADEKQFIAEEARAHVISNFSTKAMCEQVIRLYEDVVSARP